MMEVIRILEELEQDVKDAKRLPFTEKVVIEEEILYHYIDRLRTNIPEDVHAGQWLKKERQRLLEDAKIEGEKIREEALEEARVIVENAEEEAKERALDSEVYKIAEREGQELLDAVNLKAEELIKGSISYADDVLADLEDTLVANLNQIKNGRLELESSKPAD